MTQVLNEFNKTDTPEYIISKVKEIYGNTLASTITDIYKQLTDENFNLESGYVVQNKYEGTHQTFIDAFNDLINNSPKDAIRTLQYVLKDLKNFTTVDNANVAKINTVGKSVQDLMNTLINKAKQVNEKIINEWLVTSPDTIEKAHMLRDIFKHEIPLTNAWVMLHRVIDDDQMYELFDELEKTCEGTCDVRPYVATHLEKIINDLEKKIKKSNGFVDCGWDEEAYYIVKDIVEKWAKGDIIVKVVEDNSVDTNMTAKAIKLTTWLEKNIKDEKARDGAKKYLGTLLYNVLKDEKTKKPSNELKTHVNKMEKKKIAELNALVKDVFESAKHLKETGLYINRKYIAESTTSYNTETFDDLIQKINEQASILPENLKKLVDNIIAKIKDLQEKKSNITNKDVLLKHCLAGLNDILEPDFKNEDMEKTHESIISCLDTFSKDKSLQEIVTSLYVSVTVLLSNLPLSDYDELASIEKYWLVEITVNKKDKENIGNKIKDIADQFGGMQYTNKDLVYSVYFEVNNTDVFHFMDEVNTQLKKYNPQITFNETKHTIVIPTEVVSNNVIPSTKENIIVEYGDGPSLCVQLCINNKTVYARVYYTIFDDIPEPIAVIDDNTNKPIVDKIDDLDEQNFDIIIDALYDIASDLNENDDVNDDDEVFIDDTTPMIDDNNTLLTFVTLTNDIVDVTVSYSECDSNFDAKDMDDLCVIARNNKCYKINDIISSVTNNSVLEEVSAEELVRIKSEINEIESIETISNDDDEQEIDTLIQTYMTNNTDHSEEKILEYIAINTTKSRYCPNLQKQVKKKINKRMNENEINQTPKNSPKDNIPTVSTIPTINKVNKVNNSKDKSNDDINELPSDIKTGKLKI